MKLFFKATRSILVEMDDSPFLVQIVSSSDRFVSMASMLIDPEVALYANNSERAVEMRPSPVDCLMR